MGNNILKIQNQGNILSNLRLLYEMKNAGDDLHDKHGYYTKKDVARIAVMSLIATTEGRVDVDELLKHIDDDTVSETDNSILQNVKQRLQIVAMNLRSLVSMAIRKVWHDEQINLDKLLNSYGIVNE